MEFSPDHKIREIPELLGELFQYVTYDEENLFVSDEATIWDVWFGDPAELIERCVRHYGIPISREDLKLPLWQLLPILDQRRTRSRHVK